MWPYEYFNEYSTLINEFNLDSKGAENKKRKIFITKWYGNTTKERKGERGKYKKFKKIIERALKKDKVEVTIADETKQGDVITDIFSKIMEASLVVCVISPIAKDLNRKPVFCPNVMYELGLSLAWKLPVQVIAICGNKRQLTSMLGLKELKFEDFPFDINKYFIQEVNFENHREIVKIIKMRLKKLKFKKEIIISKIKRKLDEDSLKLLNKNCGLMFTLSKNVSCDTVRHLLSLSVIKVEVFPADKKRNITFGYCLTDLGRIILEKGLDFAEGCLLYPKILVDLFIVRYWKGHKKYFTEKKEKFKEEHGLPWVRCYGNFHEQFSKKIAKIKDRDFGLIDEYCGNMSNFSKVMKEVVKPWLKKIKR